MRLLFLFSIFLVLSCYYGYAPPYLERQPSSDDNNVQNPDNSNPAPPGSQNPIRYPDNPQAPGARNNNSLPYELIPDHLTALTCDHGINFGQGAYTLSLGAYDEGLKLSKEFKKNNSILDSDFSRGNSQKIRNLIEQSSLKTAFAELSLRDESNLLQILTAGGEPIRKYFPPFYRPDNISQLSQRGYVTATRAVNQRVYNSGLFRADLGLANNQFIRYGPSLAQGTYGNLLLTVMYTLGRANNYNPIFSEGRRLYGRSYKIEFNKGRVMDYLVNVYEEDLNTRERGEKWHCPEELRFIVHRNEKFQNNHFNKIAFIDESLKGAIPDKEDLIPEAYCDTTQNNLTRTQENFLKKEFGQNPNNWPFKVGISKVSLGYKNEEIQWKNTNQNCIFISPRNGSCYYNRDNTFLFRIEFDEKHWDDCYRINDLTSYSRENTDDPRYKICPAFLSACQRN